MKTQYSILLLVLTIIAFDCNYQLVNIPENLTSILKYPSFIQNLTKNKNLKNEVIKQRTIHRNIAQFIEKDTNKVKLNLSEEYHFSEKDLIRYNNLVKKTFQESKLKNTPAIIIDKSKYTLYLIDSGKIKLKFPIELGNNPYDDKSHEGDQCTPEGEYIAIKKLNETQTVFHKAFLLNYPNKEDKAKGKTGGLIEIHGGGNGSRPTENGYNWTAGCIALSNKDVDTLYTFFNKGNKITIVKYTTIIF